jgi:hypothetical protein
MPKRRAPFVDVVVLLQAVMRVQVMLDKPVSGTGNKLSNLN